LFVGLRQSEPGSVDVDAKQRSSNTFAIVKLPTVAVFVVGCASDFVWPHLIAGGGEYVHRGQRLPDLIDD
jgi:hypothetical protein